MRVKAIAHWVRIFRPLKNKYNLTLSQSSLHIATKTFVPINFDILHIHSKHFKGCFDNSEPPYKWLKIQNDDCQAHPLRQHKALYIDPCSLNSQKLVVFFGACIASKASNWANDILK